MIFNIPSPLLCLVTQSYSTLCDPMDCSPPGSSVHGDSPGKNPGSGLPCPLPGALHNPGIKLMSSALQVDSLPSDPSGSPSLLLLILFSCCLYAQSYLTLCDPMECSTPGFPVLHYLLKLSSYTYLLHYT